MQKNQSQSALLSTLVFAAHTLVTAFTPVAHARLTTETTPIARISAHAPAKALAARIVDLQSGQACAIPEVMIQGLLPRAFRAKLSAKTQFTQTEDPVCSLDLMEKVGPAVSDLPLVTNQQAALKAIAAYFGVCLLGVNGLNHLLGLKPYDTKLGGLGNQAVDKLGPKVGLAVTVMNMTCVPAHGAVFATHQLAVEFLATDKLNK